MYSFDSRVRYSEVDCNGNMELSKIIDYFQDCSCFQSEDLGVGVVHSKQTGCAWLINSWQVDVSRFPTYGEEITTNTWAYGFDSVYGYRNFSMMSKYGEVLAQANSNWIYVNLSTSRPMRLTKEIIGAYPIEPRIAEFDYSSRKIKAPEEFVELKPFTVQLHQIDSNHHVNNGQYIKIAQNYVPDDFKIWKMRAEYKRQALLGDIMIPRITMQINSCDVALVNTDGKPYCVVEFTQKAE